VKALVKLRCGNLEQTNKYWLDERLWKCIFCEEGIDCIEHFVIVRKQRSGL